MIYEKLSDSNSWNRSNHPEMREGEKWLTNSTQTDFDKIAYKSKRLGNQAFDIYGVLMKNNPLRPVFISKTEFDEHQQSLKELNKS